MWVPLSCWYRLRDDVLSRPTRGTWGAGTRSASNPDCLSVVPAADVEGDLVRRLDEACRRLVGQLAGAPNGGAEPSSHLRAPLHECDPVGWTLTLNKTRDKTCSSPGAPGTRRRRPVVRTVDTLVPGAELLRGERDEAPVVLKRGQRSRAQPDDMTLAAKARVRMLAGHSGSADERPGLSQWR